MIADHVRAAWLVDTHEHLLEEQTRLAGGHRDLGCGDWTVLLSHYASSDLCSAGLPPGDQARFFEAQASPETKFAWVAPHWARIRHTGYGQAVRRSLKILYHEDDLTAQSAPRIAERYQDTIAPGFYRKLLRDVARIRCCQVNSVEAWVFRETAQPDLLLQDIDVTALCWPAQFAEAAQELGASVDTLDGWLDLIDGVFARNSTGAVAVKSRLAYYRRLDLAADDLRAATTAFDRWRRDLPLSPEDVKALSDAATNRALRRAAQHGLPFKFHTGIYFNNNDMPLDRVRSNIADLCPAFQAHPDTTFVLFHIGYPYQHEALAAAKHYTNVHLDMCWTWIIDPVSSVRFLQAFVTTAPWTKLTAFGGDFIPVELVVGHADIARHGVTRAFEQLVAAGWLHNEDAAEVIDGVLWRNAERIYRLPPM